MNRRLFINTNSIIYRVECERNVCENELNRLRYGLENLLRNNDYDEFRNSFNYASTPPYTSRRKKISDLQITKTPIDPTDKSLLYKILEAKLFECLSTNQRIDKTPSDSISIISSLESSSISAFPSETPTLNPTLPKLTSTLEVNDYEKSRLAVPKPSISRSKKSKKQVTI